jgi:hypothetical protein
MGESIDSNKGVEEETKGWKANYLEKNIKEEASDSTKYFCKQMSKQMPKILWHMGIRK